MNRRGNPLTGPGRRSFFSLVDIILFALDARIPDTSIRVARRYLRPRKFVYVLTRVDLANPAATRDWIAALERQGKPAFAVQANTGEGMQNLLTFLAGEREKMNRSRPAGVLQKPLRLMVFGLPNVGKSSIINRLAGRVRAPAGGKPGLTRGIHWIRCGEKLLLLDTPGVLEPGTVKGDTLMALAATGAIPETRYDPVEVALWLMERVARTAVAQKPGLVLLEEFGRETGQMKKGGEIDLSRAAQLYLARFRKGEFGAFTLEMPHSIS